MPIRLLLTHSCLPGVLARHGEWMRWAQGSGISGDDMNNCLLVTGKDLRDGTLQPVPPTHWWGSYEKKSVIHAELLKKRSVMRLFMHYFFFLLRCWHFYCSILILGCFQVKSLKRQLWYKWIFFKSSWISPWHVHCTIIFLPAVVLS